MSEISTIKSQQYLLMKRKLEETFKAHEENRTLEIGGENDYTFSSAEIDMLSKYLEEQGLGKEKGYMHFYEKNFDREIPETGCFVMKVNGVLVTMFLDEFGNMTYEPYIEDIEEFKEKYIKVFFGKEEDKEKIQNLVDIDLEKILENGTKTIIREEKSPLQNRETELSALEQEEKTISEAEALIDKSKEGQNIGEE